MCLTSTKTGLDEGGRIPREQLGGGQGLALPRQEFETQVHSKREGLRHEIQIKGTTLWHGLQCKTTPQYTKSLTLVHFSAFKLSGALCLRKCRAEMSPDWSTMQIRNNDE